MFIEPLRKLVSIGVRITNNVKKKFPEDCDGRAKTGGNNIGILYGLEAPLATSHFTPLMPAKLHLIAVPCHNRLFPSSVSLLCAWHALCRANIEGSLLSSVTLTEDFLEYLLS